MKRGLLLIVWALLGALLSYGAIYLLTPFGVLVVAAVLALSMVVPGINGSRWPEALGLVAGPGSSASWRRRARRSLRSGWLPALASLGGALTAYAIVGRDCSRARPI